MTYTARPPAVRPETPPVRIARQEVGASRTGAMAIGALAIGAMAVGAVALGALAIGRLAIGGLTLGTGRAKRLTIDDLTVVRLRIVEVVAAAPDGLRKLYQRSEAGE